MEEFAGYDAWKLSGPPEDEVGDVCGRCSDEWLPKGDDPADFGWRRTRSYGWVCEACADDLAAAEDV